MCLSIILISKTLKTYCYEVRCVVKLFMFVFNNQVGSFHGFRKKWNYCRNLTYIYPIDNYMGLIVHNKNNTSTRQRSFLTEATVIITSIVTSCVPYNKVYISWCKRSAVVCIFGLIYKSRTTGCNLDYTFVDLVCVVYVVYPYLWKKRSSPGYDHRVSDITFDLGYCKGNVIID